MGKKNIFSATCCLIVSIAVMISTSINFLAARELPMPKEGPSVVEIKTLSDWNPELDEAGDCPVYVLKGEKEGGTALVLGGTHPNEPASSMTAFLFIETAEIEAGTIYVLPYANMSAMTHNDPGEGNLQYFSLPTQSGERTFRFGSRATNPVDQWPDPDVYTHYPSGQRLSGSETRNLNRAYPGRVDGNLTEQVAYSITQLITQEDIGISFDLHEASPEYPVINATVAHQNSMSLASEGIMNMMFEGINMTLEQSPPNFRGLTHREWGDWTNTIPFLMETANASQGRLRGATTEEQILGGKDDSYVYSNSLDDILYVPWDENGHPIEERCGRHSQGIYAYIAAYSSANPDKAIVYGGVPTYSELFLEAPADMLGGAQLGSFLL